MTCVYVIQTGRTTWEEQGRRESAAGAPLTEQGAMAVQDAAVELADLNIKAVYACTTGEAERQTAELVSKALGGVKVRNKKGLHELDYGLWQGLTVAEIKRRQPRAYRQWTRCPASCCPPEGEAPAAALERLRGELRGVVKRKKNGPALLVLRPVLAGLLKCLAADEPVADLWRHVDASFRWGCYEINDNALCERCL